MDLHAQLDIVFPSGNALGPITTPVSVARSDGSITIVLALVANAIAGRLSSELTTAKSVATADMTFVHFDTLQSQLIGFDKS